jgi:alkylation response protein AidB-like acyl-CoA dehydrogenase
MALALSASTEAGARLCALADVLADDLASRAVAHDRAASFPHASVEALQTAGYFTAPIPKALGGLGVASLHDLLVASSRLAAGDASVAIGLNMHLVALRNMVRIYGIAGARGDERRSAALAAGLKRFARDGVVLAAAISEPRQDLLRPSTIATTVEGGWRIDGRKIFCTGVPAASTLYTSVTYRDSDGTERYGYAMVPVRTRGVTVHDDWDALGMRSSGSHSVTFDGVRLPGSALGGGFPAGSPVPYMERNLSAGLFHASASLGIAEGAQRQALDGLMKRGVADARTRVMAAENAMDLTVARAALARGARLIDEHEAAHPDSAGEPAAISELFVEAQAAKTVVGEAAARVVERSLAMTGGGGFLNGHPIARAYRDVRAATFMNPLAANRAYELVGTAALGQDPCLS